MPYKVKVIKASIRDSDGSAIGFDLLAGDYQKVTGTSSSSSSSSGSSSGSSGSNTTDLTLDDLFNSSGN